MHWSLSLALPHSRNLFTEVAWVGFFHLYPFSGAGTVLDLTWLQLPAARPQRLLCFLCFWLSDSFLPSCAFQTPCVPWLLLPYAPVCPGLLGHEELSAVCGWHCVQGEVVTCVTVKI